MEISCGVPPSPQAAHLAVQAEKLGYDRVWLYDSPAIYEDIWAWLALCAQATDKIGLGTAVLVPHSRHVMVTASAAATIEGLAPGRLALGFGTGASARWFFAKNPLSWGLYDHLHRAAARVCCAARWSPSKASSAR